MGPVLLSLTILFAPGCKKKGDTEPVVTAPPTPTVTEAPPPPVAEPTKQSASLSRVYFDFDSSSLSGSSKSSLGKNASVMNDHSSVKVEVQGHCDERGTTEYNLALGQRRAAAAKKYLTDQGVSPSRLTVISYGEERPLERGGSESAWAQNRRAEFRVTSGGDGLVSSSLGN